MSIETIAEQDILEKSSNLAPFPKPWWGKLLVSLLVTAVPVFSFFVVELVKPEWQSGRLSDYVILFLFPEASLFFFPLLAYSMICYLLLLYAPAKYSPSFLVRFGVYSGVLLALQYSIAFCLYFIDLMVFAFLLAWILPIVLLRIYLWARTKWDAPLIHKTMIAFALGAYLVSAVLMRDLGAPFFLVLIVLIMATPFWSFLLAVQAAVWLYKNHEGLLTFPRSVGFITWIVAYVAALRFDILKMYKLYAALPPTPPDCYIATAAARGHPRFVRSWAVERADGKAMQVNGQLQRLKCAELALKAVSPRVYKLLRKIYDVAGKWLARRIQNQLLADGAYLLLKPGEWMASSLLRIIIPEIDSIASGMYIK
jgi:hypothetical protein